ncbi:MAG: hypothetical protein RL095_2783 [Verrucomicrobiota bacterium]|jgi:CheY-like chemotaxis protein
MAEIPEILLVDDDDAISRLIEMNLRRNGLLKVSRAANGRQGLEQLEQIARQGQEAHLVILLDLRMPVMDGLEMLRHLRAQPGRRQIPVIILTTSDNPDEAEECYASGCSFFMRKPVEYKQFTENVKSLADFLKSCLIPKLRSRHD